MKFQVIGDIVDFNPYNRNLTIKCDFLSPENLGIIEEMFKEKHKALKISFNFSPKKTKQYFQQKCWYGSLRLILQAKEIDITRENLQIEDEEQRRSIFPVRSYDVDGEMRKTVKSMGDMTFEEMQRAIEILHERHQHLKIKGKQIDFK